MWGYLSEFWDQIVAVGDYSVAWFEGIGNAVAGAIGALFEDLVHHIYDLFYIAQFLLENLQDLFGLALNPLAWIYNFVKGFFVSAFSSPVEPDISWVFPEGVLAVFQAVPYWDVFMFAIGAGISVLFLVFIFKLLTSL